jgi:exodeoxyribonuclease VIII
MKNMSVSEYLDVQSKSFESIDLESHIKDASQFNIEDTQPGIYRNVKNNDYHASQPISRSNLDKVLKSINQYIFHKNSMKKTKAMILGSVFHDLVLEGEDYFNKNYCVMPNFERIKKIPASEKILLWQQSNPEKLPPEFKAIKAKSAKKQKEEWVSINKNLIDADKDLIHIPTFNTIKGKSKKEQLDEWFQRNPQCIPPKFEDSQGKTKDEQQKEFLEANTGKEIVNQVDADKARAMKASLKSHPDLNIVFGDGHKELTFVWNDPETGILCKCKTDYMCLKSGYIIDLKSSKTADPMEFQKEINTFNLHLQAAFYLDGVNISIAQATGKKANFEDFFFGVVENSGTHEGSLMLMSDGGISVGKDLYRRSLGILSKYQDDIENGNKVWTGYKRGVNQVDIPHFAYWQATEKLDWNDED